MSCPSFLERRLRVACLLGALLAGAAPAAAAAPAILPFTADTWHALGTSARPLAVVFSTTDCAHCPAAIEQLAAARRQARSAARLAVVVMDGAGQEESWRAERHYRHADVLYVFAADAQALRFTVNPDWRGLTPYVALMPAAGAPRFHTGTPPAQALRDFLRPGARP